MSCWMKLEFLMIFLIYELNRARKFEVTPNKAFSSHVDPFSFSFFFILNGKSTFSNIHGLCDFLVFCIFAENQGSAGEGGWGDFRSWGNLKNGTK